MLTTLVPPTSTNLLLPETVRVRLGLATSDLPILTPLVEEASALVARYLRFQPAYGLWEETFSGQRGQALLYLGARPVWSVSGITNYAGTVEAATSYRVSSDEHAVIRQWGWGYPRSYSPWLTRSFTLGGYHDDAWDWTVEYEAGWWLETMTGSKPAGVGTLAPEVRRDFLAICRWLWNQESRDGSIKSMANEGMDVEFFASSEVDGETGIPCSLTPGLATWRRPI
jgi:hypothetical protein